MSSEIMIFLTAMLPVSELRGAIPLGFALGVPWQKIAFLSLLGNLLPVPFVLIFLRPVSQRLRRFPLWRKFFEWLFERTKKRSKMVEKFEFWGMVIFVGIPLPMTGAWTGAVAGSLLGMRFGKAILAIFLGIILAGTIVFSLVLSGKIIISL
ncbi:MAG: small multi-drug export protein [Candidatus Omnitrophica bacterium]|nr:small multi-drug export protein [Candidatus Omnitrophota bacterium]